MLRLMRRYEAAQTAQDRHSTVVVQVRVSACDRLRSVPAPSMYVHAHVQGIADQLLDENQTAQVARPGTSLNRPTTSLQVRGLTPSLLLAAVQSRNFAPLTERQQGGEKLVHCQPKPQREQSKDSARVCHDAAYRVTSARQCDP